MSEPVYYQASGISVLLPDESVLPDSIQWMPPGRQTPKPSILGKATRVSYNITAALALTCKLLYDNFWR